MRLAWACLFAGVLGCGTAPRTADSTMDPAPRSSATQPALPPGVFGVEVRVLDDAGRPLDLAAFALAMPRYRACWLDAKSADPATPSTTRTELAFVGAHVARLGSDGWDALGACVERATEGVDPSTLRGNRFAVELVAATSGTDRVAVLDASTGLAAETPMQARLDEVMACHAVARRGDPLLAGTVSVMLWFGRDGTVNGRGETVTDVSAPLTECVVGAVSNAVVSASSTERRYALVVVRLRTGDD